MALLIACEKEKICSPTFTLTRIYLLDWKKHGEEDLTSPTKWVNNLPTNKILVMHIPRVWKLLVYGEEDEENKFSNLRDSQIYNRQPAYTHFTDSWSLAVSVLRRFHFKWPIKICLMDNTVDIFDRIYFKITMMYLTNCKGFTKKKHIIQLGLNFLTEHERRTCIFRRTCWTQRGIVA